MPRRKLDRTRRNAIVKKTEPDDDSNEPKTSDDEKEEEFAPGRDDDEEVLDESDESVSPQRRKGPPRKSPPSQPSTRKKRKVMGHLDDSSSEEEEYKESDEENDESDESVQQRRTPNRKRSPVRNPQSKSSSTRKNNKKTIKLLEESSSEEAQYQESDNEDKSDVSVQQRRAPNKGKRPPRKSTSTRKSAKETDSSSDDNVEGEVSKRRQSPRSKLSTRLTAVTPSQQARRKQSHRTSPKPLAKRKKGSQSSSDESSSLNLNPSSPRSRRKQRRNTEDDEEFVPPNDDLSEDDDDEADEEEEDDGEDVWTDENESEDDDDDESQDSKVGRVGDIDEIGVANDSSEDEIAVKKDDGLDGIGIAEDSSDDEIVKKVSASNSQQKPRAQLKHDDDSSDGASHDTEIKPVTRSHKCKPGLSPRAHTCTSKHDAITLEDLPWPHVCFFPPDGERQCFSLETMRQIALQAGHPEYRNDRVKETIQQTYLQPPHFRTAMSDELLDQIASRFGRDALDLQSPYHTRPLRPERPPGSGSEDDDDDGYDDGGQNYNARASAIDVWEMLGKYLGRTMGSADLYVCPVCYRVAHKRAHSSGHEKKSRGKLSDDKLSTIYTNHFTIDPMRVLGSVDNEEFKVASMFCFRRLPLLKQHLKEEHGLDTAVVDGSDLYKKYKIRATDGLLQTFLNSGQRDYIKSMQSYWFQGNNQDFLYLLSLVYKAEEVRNLGGYDSDNPAVQTMMGSGRDYFESFTGIVDRLWNLTVDPFRKYDANMDDFIDEVGSEEEVVDDDDRNLHRTLFRDEDDDSRADDLQFARELEDRYRDELLDYEEEEDDEASKGDALVDSDEDDNSDGNNAEGNSSSSEDEFDKKMRMKRGKIGRRVSSSASKRRRRTSPQKKVITIHDDDSE